MKLYRVTLSGMMSTASGTAYGIPYVVADSPDGALEKVQEFLSKNDFGFSSDRVMKSIELLAEEGTYPPCNIQLFL